MAGRRSIRVRVTAVATVGVAAVLLVVAVLLVWRQDRQARDALDTDLGRRADALAALPAGTRGAVEVTDDDLVVQVIEGGRVVAGSTSLDRADPLAPVPPDDTDVLLTTGLPVDEGDFRLLVRRTGDDSAVIVGESFDDLTDATASLVRTLAVLIPAAAAVLGVLVWWTVGRTLAPVEQMRAEVSRITLDRLDRRVADPGGGDEIARLAATLNLMLDRLASANERQRRFLDDASHELRTPLTRLRANLELALGRPDDAAATCAAAHDEVVAMSALVDDLLFLAEDDHEGEATRRHVVDLDTVVFDAVSAERPTTTIAFDVAGVGPASVSGDERRLARMVGNLLDNAVHHATSTVRVELAERDGAVELRVADDGPGIPPAERERVFERFARLDDARTAGAGGTGLGLAIVADIARHHGGSVAVDGAAGGGARFVVTLPALDRG